MPLTRLVTSAFSALAIAVACSSGNDPESPRPQGLMVAGGQNAAFLGDTFRLSAWFTDSRLEPMGCPPTNLGWRSSDSGVVRVGPDGLMSARSLGTAVLTASATDSGRTFEASRAFSVVSRLGGKWVWVRFPAPRTEARLVYQDDGSPVVHLVPDFGYPGAGHASPAISPDGRYVSTQARRPVAAAAADAVYVVDLTAGIATSLTDSMVGHQVVPKWLSDGSTIAFASQAAGAWDIWTVRADGTQLSRRMALGASHLPLFDVSRRDSTFIVATVTASGGEDLWEARLDSGLTKRITDSPSKTKTSPAMSPDGQWIAYTTLLPDERQVLSNQVVVVPRTGLPERRLLPAVRVPVARSCDSRTVPAGSSSAAWTGDGHVVAEWSVDAAEPLSNPREFHSYLGEIYVVSLDGSVRVRLTFWPPGDAQAVHGP